MPSPSIRARGISCPDPARPAAVGSSFALFAWRAPKLARRGLFSPVSREGALVLNNLFLSAAGDPTVMLGTLYPLIRQAVTGEPISVGGPYFALTFGPLMVHPPDRAVGPLWRGSGAMRWARFARRPRVPRPGAAAAPWRCRRSAHARPGPGGLALGSWLIFGAPSELAVRTRLGATAGRGPAAAERSAARRLGYDTRPHRPWRLRPRRRL